MYQCLPKTLYDRRVTKNRLNIGLTNLMTGLTSGFNVRARARVESFKVKEHDPPPGNLKDPDFAISLPCRPIFRTMVSILVPILVQWVLACEHGLSRQANRARPRVTGSHEPRGEEACAELNENDGSSVGEDKAHGLDISGLKRLSTQMRFTSE